MRRYIKSLMLTCLSLLLLMTLLTACDGGGGNGEDTGGKNDYSKIKVMLATDEGATVISENPVYITPGETAEFEVEFGKTYAPDTLSHGEIYEDVITVKGLTRDTIVNLTTVDLGYKTGVKYHYIFNGAEHDESSLPSGTNARAGTVVTVKANESYKIFLGWSKNVKTSDKTKMLSTDREYSFRLTPGLANEDGVIRIFANYAETDAYYYDPNGGSVNMGTHNTTLTGDEVDKYYKPTLSGERLKISVSAKYLDIIESVSLFYDDGTFTREGYVLAEYNTRPDGSGDSYSLGSKFFVQSIDGELPVLYCIWKRATDAPDFEYEEFSLANPTTDEKAPHWKSQGIKITAYKGNDSTVVIPEKIDGKYVIAIGSGAFMNKTMDTLVFSRFIHTVDTGAFVGCSSLETVYYSDAIYNISNDSFDEASYTSLRNLYVNATMAPRHASDTGAYSVKLSRILASEDMNRIIVIAGSSTYQGLSTEYMEALLGKSYRVINFGTTRTTNGMIYLEAMKHFAHEGDIILYAPENSTYMMGENELYWKTLRDIESMYNFYRYIDVSNYENVFGSLADYNRTYRYTRDPQRYEMAYDSVVTKKTINKYGDYLNPKRVSLVDNYVDSYFITMNNRYKSKYDGEWSDMDSQLQNKDYIDPDNITWESIDSPRLLDQMNRVIGLAKESGARVYFTFCPADADKLVAEAQNVAWLLAYDSLFAEKYDFDGILGSSVDYVYAHKYFYDCAFHLNDLGRTYRTYQMYSDLCELLGITKKGFTSVGTDFEGCIFEDKTTGGDASVSEDGLPLVKVDYLQ